MTGPRRFFTVHVQPNYRDWLFARMNERLAQNAVAAASIMAAHAHVYWRDRDLSKVYGASTEGQYRNELATRECADFGLVRDVAEAHKHVERDRPSQAQRTDPVVISGLKWGEGKWGEWHWGEQLVIVLADGKRRPLTAVMTNVMQMWERLLADWSL